MRSAPRPPRIESSPGPPAISSSSLAAVEMVEAALSAKPVGARSAEQAQPATPAAHPAVGPRGSAQRVVALPAGNSRHGRFVETSGATVPSRSMSAASFPSPRFTSSRGAVVPGTGQRRTPGATSVGHPIAAVSPRALTSRGTRPALAGNSQLEIVALPGKRSVGEERGPVRPGHHRDLVADHQPEPLWWGEPAGDANAMRRRWPLVALRRHLRRAVYRPATCSSAIAFTNVSSCLVVQHSNTPSQWGS